MTTPNHIDKLINIAINTWDVAANTKGASPNRLIIDKTQAKVKIMGKYTLPNLPIELFIKFHTTSAIILINIVNLEGIKIGFFPLYIIINSKIIVGINNVIVKFVNEIKNKGYTLNCSNGDIMYAIILNCYC